MGLRLFSETTTPSYVDFFQISVVIACKLQLFCINDSLGSTKPVARFFFQIQLEHNREVLDIVDVVVDPHVSQHLRPHQREGVVFLYECVMGLRNFNGNGAILA